MPPREIPGFYYDEERNRYFSGTRPKPKARPSVSSIHQAEASNTASPNQVSSATTSKAVVAERRNPRIAAMTNLKKFGHDAATLRQNTFRLKDISYGSTQRQYSEEIQDETTVITVMASTSDGNGMLVTGDHRRRVRTYPPQDFTSRDIDSGAYIRRPSQLMHVSSEITSVAVARQRFIATSFGPRPTIVCGNIRTSDDEIVEQTYLLSSPKIHDIWTSNFDGRRLTLGVKNGVARISNLAIPGFDIRNLRSDAFAVIDDQHLQVLAGLRNGSICAVDFRVPGSDVLDELFPPGDSSVTYLSVLKEWELMVARLDGQLDIFDPRWIRDKRSSPSPIVSLYGNPASTRIRMSFARDFSGDYLFAGGEDGMVRGWNTRTGHRLQHTAPLSSQNDGDGKHGSLLTTIFTDPMPALLVTQDEGNEEVIRVADGPFIRIFTLGKMYTVDEKW